jgi:hypothetical protein
MIDFEELHVFDNSKSIYVPRVMYEKAYRAWKQAAKKWRGWALAWHEGLLEWQDEAFKERALAAKRLKLLRRVEKNAYYCPICREALHDPDYRRHAKNCDLARELGEQPADTDEFDGGGVA